MLILREDLQKRIGCQSRTDVFKWDARSVASRNPHIGSRNLVASLDYGLGKVELPIELERAGLNRKRARSRAGLRRFVDDANLDPLPCQPKRENESGRTSSDDQDVNWHRLMPSIIAARAYADGRPLNNESCRGGDPESGAQKA